MGLGVHGTVIINEKTWPSSWHFRNPKCHLPSGMLRRHCIAGVIRSDDCGHDVVECSARDVDKSKQPLHVTRHTFGENMQLLPDILLERRTFPAPHLLDLPIGVTSKRESVGAARAERMSIDSVDGESARRVFERESRHLQSRAYIPVADIKALFVGKVSREERFRVGRMLSNKGVAVPKGMHGAHEFFPIVLLVNAHPFPTIFLVIQFECSRVCGYDCSVRGMTGELLEAAILVGKERDILHFELDRLLRVVFCALAGIFADSQEVVKSDEGEITHGLLQCHGSWYR